MNQGVIINWALFRFILHNFKSEYDGKNKIKTNYRGNFYDFHQSISETDDEAKQIDLKKGVKFFLIHIHQSLKVNILKKDFVNYGFGSYIYLNNSLLINALDLSCRMKRT